MRIKRKKTVLTFLAFQVVLFLWYLSQSFEGVLVHFTFDENLRTDNILNRVTVGNDLHKQTKKQKKIVSSGVCSGLQFNESLLMQDSWSAVSGTKNAYIFSAFMVQQGGEVTVIGASTRTTERLYCQYWHMSADSPDIQIEEQLATTRLLPESHGNRFSGAKFNCPSPSKSANYVSMVTKKCNMPLSLMRIHNVSKPKEYKRRFTICLKPLHFRYGRAYEMVEWIELNKLIGAEKFIIYNYSVAANVNEVLKYYEQQEIVEIVQWNLPVKSYTWPKTREPVEIHSIGMLPMLQDCLYRNKPISEFVINMDVDEFIIPRSENVTNWSEMMSRLKAEADTYSFRNTFFRKEWDSLKDFPGKELAKKLKLVTLQHFERENKIFPRGSRSKYFTKTTKTNNLMIHEVQGSNTVTVPLEIGLLHHYRNWQHYNDSSKRIEDDTVLQKYGQKLIEHVQKVWNKLQNVELDIPI